MPDEQQPPQLRLVQKPSITKNSPIYWNQLYQYIKTTYLPQQNYPIQL